MLMLAALKHLHALDAAVRQGSWRGGTGRVYELYGSTVGIVGMGRIGREVARRLAGWQADLVYYDPYHLSADLEHQLNVRYLERSEGLIDAEQDDRERDQPDQRDNRDERIEQTRRF